MPLSYKLVKNINFPSKYLESIPEFSFNIIFHSNVISIFTYLNTQILRYYLFACINFTTSFT